MHLYFPRGSVVKNLPCNAGDMGSIPGQGTKILHATWRSKKKKKKSTVLLVTKSRMTLCNPMVAARQASLSFIVSQSLLKLMSGKEGGQEEKRAVEDEVVR